MRKDNTETFKEKVKNKYGDEFTVIGEYKNSTTPIKILHNCCKTEYEVIPNKFLQKRKECPTCKIPVRRLDEDSVKEKIKSLDKEYEMTGKYINMKTETEFHHSKCNNTFKLRPDAFIHANRRCPFCTGSYKKKDTEFLKQELKTIFGDEYELESEYVNVHTKVTLRHTKCNKLFEIYPSKQYLKKGKKICPHCNGYNKNLTIDDVQEELHKQGLDKEFILIDDEYKDTHTPLRFLHTKCNKEVTISRTNIMAGKYCKHCSMNGISKGEKEVVEFIKSLNVKVEENYKKLGFELDIYVPEKEIAFEYNGLYWHSEIFKDKNFHIHKTEECQKKGIRLIHIFEDEWLNNQKLVKRKIKYILNENDNTKRIYARKCFVKEISAPLKNEFLERYHIQGKDNAKIKLGLFTKIDGKNKLVSVMTFCKPRISLGQSKDKYDYELSRFASSNNYIVVGAFGKLFNYFKNNYEWNKLITYADKRWSQGNVYLTNGWKHIHDSKPNYWYIKESNKRKREHRFSYRKSLLKTKFPDIYDSNKTEVEIMTKAGYFRIWDCGNMVFKYCK